MSGRHEPPSKRSFYFSLATSTIRFAIIVALVAGGVVVISKAFPGGGTQGALPNGGGPPVTQSPTASPSKSPKPPASPQVQGVHVGVFNGTTVTGLAAATADKLQSKFGYVADQIGDAPSQVATTTLYYRSAKDKVEAEYLAENFFKGLAVKVTRLAPESDVEKSVQVAIYLGTDYAGAQQ